MTAAKLHEADDRKAKTLNTKLECRDDAEHAGEAKPSGDKVSGVWDEDNNDEERRRKDAAAAALTLEIVGDLPHAEIKPPENVLFVCKLNPITRSEDLELIFSRFGTICSCEVIKDKKTGDSLQYAFIEFEERASAEQAYVKMQNVLIDDRRIWVDFSQSVSKLHGAWRKQRAKRSGKQRQGTKNPDSDSSRYPSRHERERKPTFREHEHDRYNYREGRDRRARQDSYYRDPSQHKDRFDRSPQHHNRTYRSSRDRSRSPPAGREKSSSAS